MNQSAIASTQPSTTPSPGNRFYRTVWRWHFYAGLFVIPFMLILAATGIIYLFKPKLDAAMYHNLMFVQPAATALPYTEQVQSAQNTHPGATVTQITPNVAPDRSTEVQLATADERTLMVFVNPYTGQVLGDRDGDRGCHSRNYLDRACFNGGNFLWISFDGAYKFWFDVNGTCCIWSAQHGISTVCSESAGYSSSPFTRNALGSGLTHFVVGDGLLLPPTTYQ